MFLGYPQIQKGYRPLNPITNSLSVSRDVTFYESIHPYKIFRTPSASLPSSPIQVTSNSDLLPSEEPIITLPDDNPTAPTGPQPPTQPQHEPEPVLAVRKSSRTHKAPTWLDDYVTSITSKTSTTPQQPHVLMHSLVSSLKPQKYLNHPLSKKLLNILSGLHL